MISEYEAGLPESRQPETPVTEGPDPGSCCIHELVQRCAMRSPEAVAVELGSRRLTYRELDQRANALAHRLVEMGVGAELPVGVCLKRSLEMAIALLGVLKAGGACVPLDYQYPKDRLRYMVETSEINVLITDDELRTTLPEVASTILSSSAVFTTERVAGPDTQVQPENLAYLIFTSGSTGQPRGVLLTHRGLVNHHLAAIELYDLEAGDRVLQFSSLSFDIAIEEIYPTWIAGGTLVLRPVDMPLDGKAFTDWIGRNRITVLDLPTAY